MQKIILESDWGNKHVEFNDLESEIIAKWMKLKFIIFCHSVGISKALSRKFIYSVYKDINSEYSHLDYFLGTHYGIHLAFANGLIFNPYRQPQLSRLDNAFIFTAQFGKVYLRLAISASRQNGKILAFGFPSNTLKSDFQHFYQSSTLDLQGLNNTHDEFVVFTNNGLVFLA